jgi:hypothetical protein
MNLDWVLRSPNVSGADFTSRIGNSSPDEASDDRGFTCTYAVVVNFPQKFLKPKTNGRV